MIQEILKSLLPPISSSSHKFYDIQESTSIVKGKVRKLGADLVGVCKMRSKFVYAGKNVEHKHAISLGIKMVYDEISQAPNVRVSQECQRVYAEMNLLAR